MNMADCVCLGYIGSDQAYRAKRKFLLSCAAIPIGVVLEVFWAIVRPGTAGIGWLHWMCRCDCPCYRNCLENCCPYPCKESLYGIAIEALRINTTDTPATEKRGSNIEKLRHLLLARMSLPGTRKSYTNRIVFGICGVLLMCAATYLNSTDVESMAKQQFAMATLLSLDPANTNAEDRPADQCTSNEKSIGWSFEERFQIWMA